MASFMKYFVASVGSRDLVRPKSPPPKPEIADLEHPNPTLSSPKPLYLSSPEVFAPDSSEETPSESNAEGLRLRSKASDEVSEDSESPKASSPKNVSSGGAPKLKIGIYFATWWGLNVVYNIYNKKVFNAFPYPWLVSTLALASGSVMMLSSWATGIAKPPKTDLHFWKALAPVAVAHSVGHVAAAVSVSKVAVSFTHIIKSSEPAFSVLVSRLLMGEKFPLAVYLSLFPIIGGCGLAAMTELDFNMTGFNGAMVSNLAFVFRNIFSKKGMKGMSVNGMNYYACLSILSTLILTPFAVAIEGPKVWAAGWQKAVSQIGPQFFWWVAAQSVLYHLYNQVSYMSLDEICPLTFSVGNTLKRICVIISSIVIFDTPILPINALGSAIAILGTFIYSQAKK
ncbi:glucose-6-phosphate/phosphate translocator 2, chloroplastic-like [Typha latifolia]|uniref:glucose-6-phosphate/phosphate translocator 2, chloroplastic-like n=1 Tax=Typha latifolia TaxID=4733 RepID=UPI003C2C2C3D